MVAPISEALIAEIDLLSQGRYTSPRIFTENFNFLTLFVEYVKGDEDGVELALFVGRFNDPDEVLYQIAEWTSASGIKYLTPSSYRLEVSTNTYLQFDITGIAVVVIDLNTLGVPQATGSLKLAYALKGNARG